MTVISKTNLTAAAAATQNPELVLRARKWLAIASKQHFSSFLELRLQYPDVDRVGVRLIFNLGSYRLIVGFNFSTNRIFFKELLTHEEYDRGGWKR